MNSIPTEHIGSIPRPLELIEAYKKHVRGEISAQELDAIAMQATLDTIGKLEETGSPCIGDGEQRKFSSFASYYLHGATNIAPDGVEIVFTDSNQHRLTRRLPRLTGGGFRYQMSGDRFLAETLKHTTLPVKQAIISPAILSFLYPKIAIEGYSQNQFLRDVTREYTSEIQRCLELGAHKVQIDFTEGRLSLKLDPSGELLEGMIDMINSGLDGFSAEQRQKIGLHTCPGSDRDSTHSADVDYKYLLPTLFQANVGNFYIAMAVEPEPEKALRLIQTLLRPDIKVFIGVIDPIDPQIETPEQVRDRVLQAAQYIPVEQLGTTDDCGFSPFLDDDSTSRDTAFAKISARVQGTRMAAEILLG
ncbi:cobalamin-independent methionine synthase II family protein [Roseofilum casamattae]|uniref:Cobalamin-independent methionine synthase II family protein n=1 Tax=Roseofilum casamattae BLCC-M143 TaxID=3022442 RepID=A0ABT7BUV8_9CYAN|nr:cobalamin-independent methionine synthase II family protein [Roseofilum casamattae]MDJ1182973.1 cobalamin-independent methionine synthase II family protein [Roseofilum casamattae BLCC-M143]